MKLLWGTVFVTISIEGPCCIFLFWFCGWLASGHPLCGLKSLHTNLVSLLPSFGTVNPGYVLAEAISLAQVGGQGACHHSHLLGKRL